MTRARSIWLVARRELLERGRSRGFILSVLFTTAIVIGSFLVPSMLLGEGKPTVIGIIEPPPNGLRTEIQTTAARFDRTVTFGSLADATAGQAALDAGTVSVVVEVPADLSSSGKIQFAKEADQSLAQIISSAVVGLRVNHVLSVSGVDPGAFGDAQRPPSIIALDPQTDADQARFFVANIGAVLILIGIFTFGFAVLTGVVEEKQNRVVEVVLSTVRARDLLMGKVLGIGLLGVIQLVIFLVAAIGAAELTGHLVLPTTSPAAILLLAVWFVLGYTLYSTALGCLGALASRMEDASNASMPVTLVATVCYVVAIIAVVDKPSGIVAIVASFLPPSAPFVVPLRVAYDAITPIEIVVSIVITLAGIWGLFAVGARVYAGAVLQTGGRMRLRDAWRAAE